MSKILHSDKNFAVLMSSDEKAEITIYGRIGPSFWDEGLTTESVDRELKKLPSSVKKLTIRINSLGGSYFDGLGIYNRLKSSKLHKTVIIDATAASAASIIMLAGDTIEMGTGSMMMIHLPWIGVMANRIEMQKYITDLKVYEESALSVYMTKAKGLTKEQVRQKMIDETWFTAEECVKFGFADKINADIVKVAASAFDKCDWIRKDRVPKNLVSMTENDRPQVNETKKNITDILKLIES